MQFNHCIIFIIKIIGLEAAARLASKTSFLPMKHVRM